MKQEIPQITQKKFVEFFRPQSEKRNPPKKMLSSPLPPARLSALHAPTMHPLYASHCASSLCPRIFRPVIQRTKSAEIHVQSNEAALAHRHAAPHPHCPPTQTQTRIVLMRATSSSNIPESGVSTIMSATTTDRTVHSAAGRVPCTPALELVVDGLRVAFAAAAGSASWEMGDDGLDKWHSAESSRCRWGRGRDGAMWGAYIGLRGPRGPTSRVWTPNSSSTNCWPEAP